MKEIKIFQKGMKLMTVQEWIDELNKVKNKNTEVKFVSNQTLEDMITVDRIESYDSYEIYLEIE